MTCCSLSRTTAGTFASYFGGVIAAASRTHAGESSAADTACRRTIAIGNSFEMRISSQPLLARWGRGLFQSQHVLIRLMHQIECLLERRVHRNRKQDGAFVPERQFSSTHQCSL